METTTPKPFVFVLMPFGEDFRDTYEVAIKQACKDAGAYCERVDEQVFQEQILERIYHQIAVADLIVADMSGRNPNVFYEVGYAHALGKHTILLTRDANDIPFDLKPYPHLVYGGNLTKLKVDLETRVRWTIENPKQSLASVVAEPTLYFDGVELASTNQRSLTLERDGYLYVKIDVHNPSSRKLETSSTRLAIISSALFPDSRGSSIHLPDGRYLHWFSELEDLYPGAWTYVVVNLMTRNGVRPIGQLTEHLTLRIFTEFGFRDIELNVELNDPQHGYLR
jgi:hypothetical protein